MTELQAIVLDVVNRFCHSDAGYCTGELALFVGRQPGRDSAQQHSALVLQQLLALEKLGLVRRLDDEKPVVWCRVPLSPARPQGAASPASPRAGRLLSSF